MIIVLWILIRIIKSRNPENSFFFFFTYSSVTSAFVIFFKRAAFFKVSKTVIVHIVKTIP